MNAQDFLPGLGRISLQAGVLVLLVLLAQGIFRRHLTARWRCTLWLLVMVRLLLPFSPGSAASIFNLLPPWTNHASPSAPTTLVPATVTPAALLVVGKPMPETPVLVTQSAPPAESAPALTPTPELGQASLSPPKTSAAPKAVKLPPVTATSWLAMLFWVWLAGALLLTGYIAISSLRLAWRCRRLPALTDASALAVLDESARRLGVRGRLTVVECAEVASPALFGLFRPRLLLPHGFTQSFSTQELRFVFLHELAHLRRLDLPLNWLVAVLQILHWFNPLVWFGFARWRLDRELACDALAIEAAGADQHREYGRTILHLLENLTPRTAMPGLVGILENKHQLRRRIGMIANFRPGNRWGLPSVVLLLGLALVGLTDAQPAKNPKPTPAPISPNSNAAKSPLGSWAATPFPPFMVEASITSKYFRPNPTNAVSPMGEEATQAEVTYYSSNGWWQVEVKNLNPKTISPTPSVPYTQNSMRIPDGVREFTLFAGATNGLTAASVYPIAFPTTGDSRRLLAWLSFCPNPPLPVIDSKKMHRFLYVPGGSIALEMLNHPQNEGDFSAGYLQPGGLFLSELNVTNNGVSVDMTMDKGGDWKPEVKPYSAPWDKGFLCFRFEVLETTNFNGIAFPLRTVIKHTYPTWNPKMSDDLYVAGVLELVVKRISFAASDLANRKSAPSLLIAYDYRPPDLPKNGSGAYFVTNDVWQPVSDPNIPARARALRRNANPYSDTETVDNDLNSKANHAGVRPDLTGQVLAKGGAPLPVPATVFIATAAPKSGTSPFCPSCYADCIKHARTDQQGSFKIESLDPQLTFQVLAVAKGYQPKYVSKVDPAKGSPVTIELSPITASDAAPERSLRGRVVDPKGEPIEGAVVEMQGITTKDGGGSWGALSGIDPLAVTDENGEFLITAKKAFEMMSVKVTARTFADKVFNQLASGASDHKLVMTEGATLTGRVLLAGQPLAGVSVGVSAVDRSAGTYLGHFEVGTGDRGNFTFVNLPPDADFHLYTLMETMAKFGAVPPRQIHTGKDGETTDAKDLMVGPAYRLAGRVELADGSLVPDKTRLLISREAAWDSMQLTLVPDGKFDVTGVPAETISLSVRLKGYHVSGRNLSVDQMNPFQLLGRVDQDRTNLVFLLEKGPDPQPDYSHIDPDYGASRSRPLRGAEGGPDHSREWTVSGRVLDGETQQPVENFRVTPGQTDQFNRTAWSALSAVDGSNGYYLTYVSKRAAQPLLKVEAEGYLPESLTVLPHDATNVDFVLKKGTGPAGTVVTPDGQPAAGATIVLLGDDFNQAGLNAAGELTAYWNKSALRTADADGHFSFKPIWGMKSVAAASSNGFAMVHLESLATNSTITLEPFGKITGTLKRASGPGTNEDLDLSFADPSARGLPRLNLTSHALTDGQGRFTFDRVPPASLRISYREVMTGANRGAWTSHPLKDLELKPGQTSEVNIETTDRPAPEAAPAYQQPQPKLIPGEQVQGVVLLPNGQPAALVEVALQVEGKYLGLGKGVFSSSGAREEGLLVSAGTDGSFTLPLYEKAQSVIALNEEGYAQVSLEQLTTTPQITLQKWGHIEGTLLVGHHVGTNERVVLSAAQPRWSSMSFRDAGHSTNQVTITNASPLSLPPPIYDFNVFQAKTDDQGRFVITFVPPGQQTIARMVSTGEGSWSQSQLAIVDVKPGETTVTNVGGAGRAVTGKVRIAEGAPPDFKGGFVSLIRPTTKLMQQASQLKTDEERKAFYQFAAFQAATQERRIFTAALLPDGSFRADDVLPGEYVLSFRPRLQRMQNTMNNKFTSSEELLVPEAKDKDDDSSVDWGEIELRQYTIPMPSPTAGGK